jgi:mannose-6-phosphate isomerase-like protein (cupin superfamily)
MGRVRPESQQALHSHTDIEQIYVIVQGRGEMIVGDERSMVEAGTLVFIPPGTDHAILNPGDDPLVYVSAASPPFDPSTSGRWAPPDV